MLYDDGYAGFYQLFNNFTKSIGKLTKSIPKKQKNLMEFYKKSVLQFDLKVIRYILDHFDLDKMKLVVIAGPGNPKNRLLQTIKTISSHEKDLEKRKLVEKNASKFVAI